VSDHAVPPSAPDAEIPRLTRGVETLIIISVAVLFFQEVVANFEDVRAALGFSWPKLSHWWSWATYPFVHGGVVHLTLNLSILFLFGPRLEHAWGTNRFLAFCFFSALGGLALSAMFVHDSTSLIGSTAVAFGVMAAYAMQWPDDHQLLLGIMPLRAWSMVIVLVALSLGLGVLTAYAGGGSLAYFAHLGGLLAGWVYMRTPGSAHLDNLRNRVSRTPDVEESPRAIPKAQPRNRERMDETDEIVARSKAIAKRSTPLTASRRRREVKADELNRVLDKISAEGLESLTSDERKTLEEMAKRMKGE
jgi:membrane associated rhomboid family serine protease